MILLIACTTFCGDIALSFSKLNQQFVDINLFGYIAAYY